MINSKILRWALISAAVVSLTACTANRQGAADDQNMNDRNENVRQYAYNLRNTDRNNNKNNNQKYEERYEVTKHYSDAYGNTNGIHGISAYYVNDRTTPYGVVNDTHNNTRVELSEEIAEQLTAMREIESANVLLTDTNAYVAVEVEDAATGNTNGDRTGDLNGDRNGNRNGGRNGNQANVNRNRGTDTGFGTARYERNDEVAADLKERIASTVRTVKPDIQNVYVSANPDFMERMNGFMSEVRNERPVRGFINEFNNMMNRMFPTRAGENQGDRGTDQNR
jgi:YhcN/YlaJ family sporulation lipoprotein